MLREGVVIRATELTAALALGLVVICLTATVIPLVLATDYTPGVSAGDYVTFGDGGWVSSGFPTQILINWEKLEVVSVDGKEVTWIMTGQMKNGSALTDNGTVYVTNVETGATNYTHSVLGAVIAANLNEGDKVPTESLNLQVNSTELSTYMGVSRTVDIVSYEMEGSTNGAPYTLNSTFVYDQRTGMMLETDNEINTVPMNYSARQIVQGWVTDTNLFSSSPPPLPSSTEIIYVVVAVAVAVL